MGKKCIICEADAKFAVKGTSDFYCPSCAEENFGDLTLLVAIEEQAKQLKAVTDAAAEDFEVDEGAEYRPQDESTDEDGEH